MVDRPRRRYLRLCGVAAVALAGCAGQGDQATPNESAPTTRTEAAARTTTTVRTTTESPEPTDTETPEETETPAEQESLTTTAWTVEDLSGRVDTLGLPEAGPTDDPEGPLYAATEAGEVARLEPTEGTREWVTTVRGEREENDPALTPAGDAVYAVGETYSEDRLANHVQALDPAAGRVRWTFEGRYFLGVCGVAGDVVVVAGDYIAEHPEEIGPNQSPRGDGVIFGVDRATGEERWSVDVPALDGADVASHGVYALSTSADGDHHQELIAFDRDGRERWRADTNTVTPHAPLATADLLLAGASDDGASGRGGVGRYDPVDGSLLWRTGEWDRGPGDLAVDDGVIHAGAGPFLALDPDGTERYRVFRFGVPDARTTPETLYGDGGGSIGALDRAAGEIRWRYTPEDFEYTHLRAVLADHVAVDRGIGEDRGVVVLEEQSGEIAGVFETAGDYWGAVGAGRRLFLGVDADIVAYDLATA